MNRCRGEAFRSKAAKEGSTAPIVGLALLVSSHVASCCIDGQLVVAVAAPIYDDTVLIHCPVRMCRILLANKVVRAVGMELDLSHYVVSKVTKVGKSECWLVTSKDPLSYSKFQTLPPFNSFSSVSEKLRTNWAFLQFELLPTIPPSINLLVASFTCRRTVSLQFLKKRNLITGLICHLHSLWPQVRIFRISANRSLQFYLLSSRLMMQDSFCSKNFRMGGAQPRTPPLNSSSCILLRGLLSKARTPLRKTSDFFWIYNNL